MKPKIGFQSPLHHFFCLYFAAEAKETQGRDGKHFNFPRTAKYLNSLLIKVCLEIHRFSIWCSLIDSYSHSAWMLAENFHSAKPNQWDNPLSPAARAENRTNNSALPWRTIKMHPIFYQLWSFPISRGNEWLLSWFLFIWSYSWSHITTL